MRKLFLILLLLFPLPSFADDVQTITNLMELGMSAELATELVRNSEFQDLTLDNNLTVGGSATVTGTVSGEQLTTTDDLTVADDVTLGTSSTVDGTTSIIGSVGAVGQVTLTDGTLEPVTDDDVDLGTASAEFKDGFFDGTVTLDNLSMPISVVAGADTACSTTCTGFCFFGVNTAATEADIVDCADATADECLCVE